MELKEVKPGEGERRRYITENGWTVYEDESCKWFAVKVTVGGRTLEHEADSIDELEVHGPFEQMDNIDEIRIGGVGTKGPQRGLS